MYYLIAAIAANLFMVFLMRYAENHNVNRYGLNIWNYLAGAALSFFFLEDKSTLWAGEGGVPLLLGILNGALFVTSLVLMQISIRRNGAPLSSTFSRLGVVIPTILSAFIFREIPTVLQTIGLAVCIAAVIIINSGAKDKRPDFAIGLVIIFLLGGVVDFLAKTFSMFYSQATQNYYVMYTFFFAAIISLVLFIRTKRPMGLREILIGIGVGIPNQLTTILLLRAASRLPAIIVYPTMSAGIILMVNIINYIAFREKLTRRQYIATGLIGLGLVLINLL